MSNVSMNNPEASGSKPGPMLRAEFALGTWVQRLSERAQKYPDTIAFHRLATGPIASESQRVVSTLSYGEFERQVRELAGQLQMRTELGDRVVLVYSQPEAFALAFFACLYAGVVAVPTSAPRATRRSETDRFGAICFDAQPRLTLTDMQDQPLLRQALQVNDGSRDGSSSILTTNARGLCSSNETDAIDGHADIRHGAPQRVDASWRCPALTGKSLALLQYTSGSTAEPRGVCISHGNLMAGAEVIAEAFEMEATDIVVSWLPLFHDMGLIGGLLQPLHAGAAAVLMSPSSFLRRPISWLRAVERFRGTVSGAPDFAYQWCVRQIKPEAARSLDLRSWRLAFCGAEPVVAATLDTFTLNFLGAGFSSTAFYPCYGLAEATLLVTGAKPYAGAKIVEFDRALLAAGTAEVCVPGALQAGIRLVGCGKPRGGLSIRITATQGEGELPGGRVGEIEVRGPSVSLGYFNREQLGENLVRTGDLGFIHDDNLFIVGRLKDVILIRGQNFHPSDIEQTLRDRMSPLRLGRVAAFAMPARRGEAIALMVEVGPVLRRLVDVEALAKSIAEALADELGEPAQRVWLLSPGSIPVTSSGKVRRSACRDLDRERSPQAYFRYDGPFALNKAAEGAGGVLREKIDSVAGAIECRD